jgi:hypothetical protein
MGMKYTLSPPCAEVVECTLPIHVAITKAGGRSDSKGDGVSGVNGGSGVREGRKRIEENAATNNGTCVLGKRKVKKAGNGESMGAGDRKRIRIVEDKTMAEARI